jgi:hypothetical protein
MTTGYRPFFQTGTTTVHLNIHQVSPTPHVKKHTFMTYRYALWTNGRCGYYLRGTWRPQALRTTAESTGKKEK